MQQRRAAAPGRCPAGLQVQPAPSSASSAVARARGSTTTSPPRAARRRGAGRSGGMVSATLLPSSRTASAPPRSVERERQAAVDAERPVAPRPRRRRHAEPAVVVDVRRAQRDPGELAQLVRLLVGQPAAAEHGDRVGAVLGAGCAASRRPRGRAPRPRSPARARRRAADQRGGEPVGAVEQLGAGPALLAQAAAVGREVGRGGDRRPRVAGSAVSVMRALQRAVRAVRVDASAGARSAATGRRLRCRRAEAPSRAAGSTAQVVSAMHHVQRRRRPTARWRCEPVAAIDTAKPRGMRKPPNAPTAPAMPMAAGRGLACDGSAVRVVA